MYNSPKHVCPVEMARSLDNIFRIWFQNPRKILAPFIREGMTVLDIGCGPGFFSTEIAEMVGPSGRVIACDLQKEMLEIVARRITSYNVCYTKLLRLRPLKNGAKWLKRQGNI